MLVRKWDYDWMWRVPVYEGEVTRTGIWVVVVVDVVLKEVDDLYDLNIL